MKQVKIIINLITLLLCTNIALAQEKTELQLAIDSVEMIPRISLSANNGWGKVPKSWELQERLKALATDDDLARITLESKSPEARVFAYITLVEKKSDKCFDLLKKMIIDDSIFGLHNYDVLYNDRVNNYVIRKTIKADILDSTQIAYIDSFVIFSPEMPGCAYLYNALEKVAPQPEYYTRICQLFDEGHWGALKFIAMYKKEKDAKRILKILNEYKTKTYAEEWDYYEMVLEEEGEEKAKKLKPKHPRKEEHSDYAISAIAQWQHPMFIPTLEKYIESKQLSDIEHYYGSREIMKILMNYDNDWAYEIMERYLKHPMNEYYTEFFADIYKDHENKERFTPLYKKYCKQSNIVLVVSSNQEGKTDSIYYTIDDDKKEASVTYSGSENTFSYLRKFTYSGDITIPSTITYNGITYTVTSIGDKAFYNAKRLHSITMPNTITSIGSSAFYACSKLKHVKLSETLTSIGPSAFSSCDSLSSIILPNTLTSIGNRAFSYCQRLTSITIPRSVTSIGTGLFMNSNITSITIDKGNPVYDSRNDCNAIIETKTNKLIIGCATTTIPNDVTSIGEMAFLGCPKINTIAIPESVTKIEDDAFSCSDITSLTLPQTIKHIGASAFQRCSKLESITIPMRVKIIKERTFQECAELTNITISDSITSIEGSAFEGCTALTSIEISNSVTSIGERAFENCKNLTSVHIGKSLTSFKNNIFIFCNKLDSISVDKDNTTFDSRNDCNAIINSSTNELVLGLNTTIIPNTVTGIEEDAFKYRKGLKTIVIPESVKHIGKKAFYACRNLTSVTLPSSLKKIGEAAFYDCNNMKNVISFSKTPQKIDSDTFPIREIQYEDLFHGKSVKKEIFLHIPKGSMKKYSKAKYWKEFTIIEDED